MTASRLTTTTFVLVFASLPALADAQLERDETEASDPNPEEHRTEIVRDVTTTGAPARRRRDAALELNDDIDGERLDWWPWVASFSLASVGLAIDSLVDTREPRWSSVGPLDLNITEALVLGPAGRSRAATVSDIMLISSVLATYLDAALWRQNDRSNSRTAYRLIMLDSMVFSMNTALVALIKGTVQRQRPAGRFCESDPEFGGCQDSAINRSFFSGHASTTFTAASLMCAHQHLRGQSPLGRFQCITGLGVATTTSMLRLVAAKHYMSDVLVGAVVGFLIGYIFPVYIFPRALPLIPTERAVNVEQRVWW